MNKLNENNIKDYINNNQNNVNNFDISFLMMIKLNY